MAAPDNLFSIGFRHQKLGLLMAVILGIMVYLSSLAMAGQAFLARAAWVWGGDLQNRITLEADFPGVSDKERAAREDKVFDAVKDMPGVEKAERIASKEMHHLLKAWIGDSALVEELPLPFLIDLQMKPDVKAETQDFEKIVEQNGGKDMRLHPHVARAGPLKEMVGSLGWLALIMLLLTGLAVVALVAITCTAVLAAQFGTISLLHYLGADHETVAAAFQAHVKRWAFPACGAGFSGAFLTLGILALTFGSGETVEIIAPMSLGVMSMLMLIVPAFAFALALGAARFSVLVVLRRTP